MAHYVAALAPDLLIVNDDDRARFSEIGPLLDGSRYAPVFTKRPYTVWARAGVSVGP